MFIDTAKIHVKAGDGGNGCNSYFRDTRVEHGKANGGDGGDGGDVILRADKSIYTLLDFQYQRHFKAENGKHGSSNDKAGGRGQDKVVSVPLGTVVTDLSTGYLIRDLNEHGLEVMVAKGGISGRGNSRNRDAELGAPGEERELGFNLKLIADVGIVGFPNAGKSTLISKISNAQPKIASYPFTTKAPTLGVVDLEEDDSQFIIADIPGLIEGAHKGKGLGDKFLKHVERTKILVHLVDMAGVDGRDPWEDFRVLNEELEAFSQDLTDKKQIIVANKMDLEAAAVNIKKFKKHYRKKLFEISALKADGLEVVVEEIAKYIKEDRS
ncbi:MAG: GTPase ObgE [Candidatus Omnitrophota bacterium]